MNREDIIRMAREAGFDIYCGDHDGVPKVHVDWYCITSFIERFAALVAAAEREECAKVCDEVIRDLYIVDGDASEEVLRCAKTIRSRGEVKP